MALNGLIGTWAGPYEPGTGYVMAHHSIGDVGDGHLGSWAVPEGGMGAVSDAIASSARAFGAEVRTDARVARILTEGRRRDRASCSTVARRSRAPLVVTAIHPKITFLRAARPGRAAGRLRRRHRELEDAQRRREDQLRARPRAGASPPIPSSPTSRAAFELAHSIAYLEKAFEEARAGGRRRRRSATASMPTVHDRTLAPEGKHVIVAVHAVGAPRVERGAAQRRARGLRRPRDRRLRRARARVRRLRAAPPGDRPVRDGAGVGADRRQHLPRRAQRRAAVPHATRRPATPTTALRSAGCIKRRAPRTAAAASAASPRYNAVRQIEQGPARALRRTKG